MGRDIQHDIGVALDAEIKSPRVIDAGLPDVPGLIVFLGAERGVLEMLNQERSAPIKRSLDCDGSARIVSSKTFGVVNLHQDRRAR